MRLRLMGRVIEALAVLTLVISGAAIVIGGAPVLENVIVVSIVVAGVWEWWAVRKLGKEARDVGNRLVLLCGLALLALGTF
jgi:hypothetical protein